MHRDELSDKIIIQIRCQHLIKNDQFLSHWQMFKNWEDWCTKVIFWGELENYFGFSLKQVRAKWLETPKLFYKYWRFNIKTSLIFSKVILLLWLLLVSSITFCGRVSEPNIKADWITLSPFSAEHFKMCS